jgi:hypothetical protein
MSEIDDKEHVTDGGQCWCFPDYIENDPSIIVHHSASQLADMRRDDARRFIKVIDRALKNPKKADGALSWLRMQCGFILDED